MGAESNNKLDKLKSRISLLWENPKVSYTSIIILLILAAIFGGWRIVNSVRAPFVRDQVVGDALQTNVSEQVAGITELRNKDTDGDGLSDYDESYVYGTSPYLEDTDSDGYLDKTEIETGNNPNCPAGQKCLANTVEGSDQVADTGTNSLTSNPLDISNEELRQLLLDSGADPAVLSQVDDATLRQMYNEVITNIQLEQTGETSGNNNINTNTDISSDDTLQQLQNLSADEVRQLLLQSGVKAEDLEGVSDEELMSFYQEVLSQELSK